MIASVEAVDGDNSRWSGGPIARVVPPWNNGRGNCVDACAPDCEVVVPAIFDTLHRAKTLRPRARAVDARAMMRQAVLGLAIGLLPLAARAQLPPGPTIPTIVVHLE